MFHTAYYFVTINQKCTKNNEFVYKLTKMILKFYKHITIQLLFAENCVKSALFGF